MSNLFFRNRRLLLLFIGLILVAGLSSFYVLPRMEDPMLSPRLAIINTLYPGASAERVESLVTEKLEEELREIEEINEIRSSSRAGVSTLTMQLRDDVYDTDPVWSRIRDKLADAEVLLPKTALKPEFDDLEVRAYARIVAIRWNREDEPNYAILRRLAETLKDELMQVSATDDVDIFGDPKEEFVVSVDQNKLIALGMSVRQVADQISASDSKISAGQLRGTESDFLVEVDSELDSNERIEKTPVGYGETGQVVFVSDIATVTKGIQEPPSSLSFIDGKPAVVLGVFVRADRRIDVWNNATGQLLDQFQNRLPNGVGLYHVFEQNQYVDARLSQLATNLLLGGLAVFCVVFISMGWQNAISVGIALPLSALMVIAGLRFLGIPIHQMSITGLILALGLLIDNAIVIIDEVSNRIQQGDSPAKAVSSSVKHLAIPLFGSTLTTALAFAPIALMEGPAGEFVGSISVSVILAIFSSFILAMTVTPAIGAILASRSSRKKRQHWWELGINVPSLARVYRTALDVVLKRPILGLAIGMVFPILGFIVAGQLPEQFFPSTDRDQFYIDLELSPNASMMDTASVAAEVRKELLKDERIKNVHWFVGESGPTFYYNVVRRRRNSPFYAQALVQIHSPEGRMQLTQDLQKRLDQKFPKARLIVRQLEQGPPFDAPIEVRIFGPDVEQLRLLSERLRTELVHVQEVIHLKSELVDSIPKIALQVDEEQTRFAGLDHLAISSQLDATLEGAVGGSVIESTEELPVRVRTHNSARADWNRIASLDLLAANTNQASNNYAGVPLTAIANLQLQPESSAITRFNGRRMSEVKAYITSGVLPAKIQSEFRAVIDKIGFELPPGYELQYGGESAKRNNAVGNLMANVGILVTCMVATLVLSFGSFRMAGIIAVVALLSSGLGVGAIWIFGYPFGFMAIIGSMGLIGVAINDAIVVLAALRNDQKARVGEVDAVNRVVRAATRHVVATSLTTMAGFAPLILGGGLFWPPLAVAIGGGVGGATILALFFVPSLYVMVMCRKANSTDEPIVVPNERISTNVEVAASA